MRLFRFPKRDPKRFDDETPFMRFLRLVIIGLLFAGVIYGFWLSQERQTQRLNTTPRPSTSQNAPHSAENSLVAYAAQFKDVYGMTLYIRVEDARIATPVLSAGENADTFFIGLCPSLRQVVLEMPRTVQEAMGESFVAYLRDEHFRPYFDAASWPQGLAVALNLLTARLDATLLPASRAKGHGNTADLPSS